MTKDNRKNNNVFAMILLAFSSILFVVFTVLMFIIKAFPTSILIITIAVMAVILALVAKLLRFNKGKKKQRVVGIVLSIIFIIVMAFGSYYLYSTYVMLDKISGEGVQTEDFHAIVLEESEYEELRDIKGEEVFVTDTETNRYKEAKDIIEKKAKVEFKTAGDYIETGSKLVDDQGNTNDAIIFISNAYYEILCEDIAEYDDKTKIIYTVPIEIESKMTSKKVDVTKDSFNVYISGIDTFGSINNVSRSDVNMIMTVNPKSKEILLTSIPRDMYLPLHTYGEKDKLTHSGIYGIDETIMTVEDWLGIGINHYVRVNFTTLVDIVNAIDGIDVESEYAFSSSVSEYSYAEGTNHLDGEAALHFARERKSLEGGDAERIKNQQRVLKGIINKMTTSPVILTKYTKLLDAVGDEMQTSLTERDMGALVKMQLEDLGGWDIKMQSLKGEDANTTTYSMGDRVLYVVIPDEGSVKACQDSIEVVMTN